MPLNDALTAFLTEMAAQGVKPIHESTPEEVRALTAGLSELFGTGPEMARVEDTTIPVEGGSIAARILVPNGTLRGVFIYYHGGGWVIGGNVEEYDTLGRKLAERTGCAVVLVDYRLAPEHRYPVAVDDSYAALEWVAAHLADIAGGPVPIVVGGDSAGGNLSAIVAQHFGHRLAGQLLIYPAVDMTASFPSIDDNGEGLFLTKRHIEWFQGHYIDGTGLDLTDPILSPCYAADGVLAATAPAFVLTAEYDPLRDEGEAYAAKLDSLGVPTKLTRYDGMIHAFYVMKAVTPSAVQAIDDSTAFLSDVFG
jgi:acetyl esterase